MPPVHRDLSEFKLKAKPFIKALRVKNDAFCNLMKSKKELERELNKCKRELKYGHALLVGKLDLIFL